MAEILVRPVTMKRHPFQQPMSPAYCHPTLPSVSRGGKFGSMSASGGSALCQSMRYADAWLYSGGRASLFGTVRGPSSKSRPKLSEDPYQAMRKSRLVLGTTSPVRKSILECQINPYKLIESSDSDGGAAENQPKGLRIGGQTVRVSKETPRSSIFQSHLAQQQNQVCKQAAPQQRHQSLQHSVQNQVAQHQSLQRHQSIQHSIQNHQAPQRHQSVQHSAQNHQAQHVVCQQHQSQRPLQQLTPKHQVQQTVLQLNQSARQQLSPENQTPQNPPTQHMSLQRQHQLLNGSKIATSRGTIDRSTLQSRHRGSLQQINQTNRLTERSRAVSASTPELKPKRPPRRSKTVSPPPAPKSILKNSPNPPVPKPSHQPLRASFKEFKNRKKKQVQFKMSTEKLETKELEPTYDQKRNAPPPAPPPPPPTTAQPKPQVSDGDSSDSSGSTKLRRSLSDLRANKQIRASMFNDTMRLRQRQRADITRAAFHSDEEGHQTPVRPKVPPPPPPALKPSPPPRQVFPFTKDQIAGFNKNREDMMPSKIIPTDQPFPPQEKYSKVIVSDPEDNYVKVHVPSKNDDNRTVVTVTESPQVRIQIEPDKKPVDDKKEPIYVISNGNKVTISINGFGNEKEQYDNVEENSFRSKVDVNDFKEEGRTLLVVDHVSELRTIMNGQDRSASTVKSRDVIGDSVREIEKIGSELGFELAENYDVTKPGSDSSESKYDSTPSDVSDKGYEASNPSSESSDGKYDLVGHDDSSDIYREKDKLVDEVEIRLGLDYDTDHYETIRDPIYEEISDEPPPLPTSPPPCVVDQPDEAIPTKSIFEGATKYDILNYLAGAKRRGIVAENSLAEDESVCSVSPSHSRISSLDYSSRISQMSNASDSSEESGILTSRNDISLLLNDQIRKGNAEVERNDSGVGSETSSSSRSRWQHLSSKEDQVSVCEDCDQVVETQITDSGVLFTPLVCRKCGKRRAERREIITEIVETEEKYGRDLRILMDEFYRPMLVAGLLSQEQLGCIFLNAEELMEHSRCLAEKLRDALEIALENGDEDLLTVNVGRIFLDATPIMAAFQSYCTRQGGAAMLLANLEKEKELLRIFLRVSQMENSVLRRMNLNSFLMVPVQRVTKYPLLLSRLYKVTPVHIVGREAIREAQENISMHLEQINYLTKDISPTKIWRKISVINGKKFSDIDMINVKLRKVAVDLMEWKEDEVRFCVEGKLLYTQPQDSNWKRRATLKLNPILAVLLTLGKASDYQVDIEEDVMFPKLTGVREATLILLREKSNRYSLIREPLYLDRCIVCSEGDFEDYFEVQELSTKDTYIFKAEDNESTKRWYKQLQYHAQGLGTWRKRRNALANIMINGMLLRS